MERGGSVARWLGGSVARWLIACGVVLFMIPALAGSVAAAPLGKIHNAPVTPFYRTCSTTIWIGATANNWTYYVGAVRYSGSVVLVGLMDGQNTHYYCGQAYSYATINTVAGSAEECVKASLYYRDPTSGNYYTIYGNYVCAGAGSSNTSQTSSASASVAEAVGTYTGIFGNTYSTALITP